MHSSRTSAAAELVAGTLGLATLTASTRGITQSGIRISRGETVRCAGLERPDLRQADLRPHRRPARNVLREQMAPMLPVGPAHPNVAIVARRSRCPTVGAGLVGLALCGSVLAGGISIVDDLSIGVWSPFGTRWEAEAGVCVEGDESFRVIATSVGGDTFALFDGARNEVPYRVDWYRSGASDDGEQLDPEVPSLRSIVGAALPGCGGGTNARVRVSVERLEIERAVPGIYADTLLLTLTPL